MTVTGFITDLPDIPRIITALAQWLACLVCILPLKRRDSVRGGKFAAVSALFLAVQCIYMVATDGFGERGEWPGEWKKTLELKLRYRGGAHHRRM